MPPAHVPVRLEVAVDNARGVLASAKGGAERLELCSSLAEGGLTPSQGFLEWTLEQVSIPVHCMLRPRAGNFVYSRVEFDILVKELRQLRNAGAQGVVTGILTREHTVDVEAMRRVRDLAYPMRLCFHRAFDITVDRRQALEDVIGTGADVLLTSGGAASLFAGAAEATRIVRQAAGRIEVMGGESRGAREQCGAAMAQNSGGYAALFPAQRLARGGIQQSGKRPYGLARRR